MHITIEKGSYYAIVNHCLLAVQGENNTRTVFFTYPEVSGADSYYLRVQLPNALIYDLPITEQKVLLPASVTVSAGIVPIQWIAKNQDGSIVAKSQMIPSIVKASIDGDTSALPTPEEMKTYYDTYINTITEKGDQYLSEMETIQQNVRQTSETVKADADRTESNVNRAESLLQSMQGYTIGERARLYVDTASGSDNNDGRTTTTAVKTLDRVLVLANAYKNTIICLKRGQTYTATDQTNEYGSGIHLYSRSIRLEAIQNNDSLLPAPKVENAIFLYHGCLEIDDVDFASSTSGITLYNSFCRLNKSTMQYIKPQNSVIMLSNCTTPYLLQYGGCSAIYGGKLDSIQVENGGFLNFANCQVTGYVSAPPSIICKNGIPIYMERANQIANDSAATITRYVNAASGSDSSPGTESAPYRTLKEALNAVTYAKKGVIYLTAGTYTIPDKDITWMRSYISLVGNSASDTVIKGNISLENSYLKLSNVTLDCTNAEYANTSATAPLRILSGSKAYLENAAVSTVTQHCISATESSNVYCSKASFAGCTSYAVLLTGDTSATIYRCTDESGKGLQSSYGCKAYIINSPDFSYSNGYFGMVYVDGQQMLPQTVETGGSTEVDAAIATYVTENEETTEPIS